MWNSCIEPWRKVLLIFCGPEWKCLTMMGWRAVPCVRRCVLLYSRRLCRTLTGSLVVQVDPTYTVHFHDGSEISLTNDFQRMEKQLESMEKGSFKQFLGLIKQGHDNLHITLAAIAHRNFYSLFEFFSPANFWLLFKLNVFRKHYSYIKGVFTDPRLRAAFTFQVSPDV